MMNIDIDQRIREIWGEQGSHAPPICTAAHQFQQWADALCAEVARIAQKSNDNGVVAVNQAYVKLLIRYFDWRNAVPKVHRTHIGATGHTCLFDVFERAYMHLRVIELSLSPPMLYLPASPPPRIPRNLSIADVLTFGPVSPEISDLEER
jgi:hypothetical protein